MERIFCWRIDLGTWKHLNCPAIIAKYNAKIAAQQIDDSGKVGTKLKTKIVQAGIIVWKRHQKLEESFHLHQVLDQSLQLATFPILPDTRLESIKNV